MEAGRVIEKYWGAAPRAGISFVVMSSPGTGSQVVELSARVAIGNFDSFGQAACEIGIAAREYSHAVEVEAVDFAELALEGAVGSEESHGDFTGEVVVAHILEVAHTDGERLSCGEVAFQVGAHAQLAGIGGDVYGRPCGVVAVARLDIIYNGGEVVEAVALACVGIQRRAGIPATVVVAVDSAPSPVDVYHLAERIETVDHEGMACSHILSAVQYGTACADFVLHNMVEFGLSCCFGTLFIGNTGIVAEIVDESRRYFHFIGARTGISELGADTNAGVIDESGNSIGLFLGIAAVVVVHAHVIPVVGHVEVHAVVAARASFGEIMVFHNHGHGSAHATCQGASGNHAVERSFLAPLGCVEKNLFVVAGGAAHHHAACVACSGRLHAGGDFDFTFKSLHHPFHGRRKRRYVVGAFCGVAKYWSRAVIGRHDYESMSVAGIEYIVERFVRATAGVSVCEFESVCCRQPVQGTCLEKFGGQSFGVLDRYGFCLHYRCGTHQK